MKIIAAVFLILLSACSAWAASGSGDEAQNLYVKVRETKLRSSPAYLAPAVAGLRFGDALRLISSADGSWLQVSTAQGKKGFIHLASVSNRKIVLTSSSGVAPSAFGTSNEEVVLAGKGFSAEVEKNYASQNSALNFAAVNSMESLKVSEAEVRSFVKAGGLKNGAL